MQHNDSYQDSTYSFVNNIITPEGGTHLAGFKNALTKTFNDYARKNKDNMELVYEILEKAKKAKGISHKEAAVLLECDNPEANAELKKLAVEIKEKFYGRRIVMSFKLLCKWLYILSIPL